MKVKVKIKKLVNYAVIPTYSKEGDAGMDLVATSKSYDEDGNVVYGTGLAFEIPKGYVGLLFPRSSNAKKDLLLSNSVGVLDSGYRGEVMFKFKSSESIWDWDYSNENSAFYTAEDEYRDYSLVLNHYEIGERIGQIIILPYPQIEFEEAEELSESERNTGGFGRRELFD